MLNRANDVTDYLYKPIVMAKKHTLPVPLLSHETSLSTITRLYCVGLLTYLDLCRYRKTSVCI